MSNIDNYEAQCLQLDKGLAELLGFTDVKDSVLYPSRIAGKLNGEHQTIARWTKDDAEAFRLASEYSIDIGPELQADYWDGVGGDSVRMQYEFDSLDHKMKNIRKVIVESVIHKLKRGY